jgi:hypothetical protein
MYDMVSTGKEGKGGLIHSLVRVGLVLVISGSGEY